MISKPHKARFVNLHIAKSVSELIIKLKSVYDNKEIGKILCLNAYCNLLQVN